MNGRVQLSKYEAPFLTVPNENTLGGSFEGEALRGGNIQRTDVSSVYFSEQNIDALQKGIRYLVYKNTQGKYTISNQSEHELKIIMRSIFYSHSKNFPFQVLEQVKELNKKVLDFCVPRIIVELQQNELYRKDISTLPVPLEHGRNESVKGTKTSILSKF